MAKVQTIFRYSLEASQHWCKLCSGRLPFTPPFFQLCGCLFGYGYLVVQTLKVHGKTFEICRNSLHAISNCLMLVRTKRLCIIPPYEVKAVVLSVLLTMHRFPDSGEIQQYWCDALSILFDVNFASAQASPLAATLASMGAFELALAAIRVSLRVPRSHSGLWASITLLTNRSLATRTLVLSWPPSCFALLQTLSCLMLSSARCAERSSTSTWTQYILNYQCLSSAEFPQFLDELEHEMAPVLLCCFKIHIKAEAVSTVQIMTVLMNLVFMTLKPFNELTTLVREAMHLTPTVKPI